jgi:two-component system sensor histidine kinase MtrB
VTSRRFPRRLGLRARVTLVFSLGTLVLATAMATLAFGLARNYLLRERQASAEHQTFTNAQLVRSELRSAGADVTTLLGALPTGSESQSLLYRNGHWFATSVSLGPTQLPADLRKDAVAGVASTQRFRANGTTQFAVATPISAGGAVYIQVYSLTELDSTLRILSASLAVAALVTTAAGAGLGRWASKRALQPVRDVSEAAEKIASGTLGTRLRAAEDPDLERLAGAFNSMVDALESRLARDARFASDVSHELRSPLTTLSTALSVLERNTSNWTPSQQQALGLMAAEIASFTRLVADLLEISRSDAGATVATFDDVPAGDFLNRVAAATCPQVPVVVADGAAECVVHVDKRRLERSLANLIDNAQQHAGGVVRLTLRREAGVVQFGVEDAGPGIPIGDRERVFERFARGSSGRRPTGTGVGLGLALVADHVALQDGTVLIEDRPGGGARFIIELPLQAP